MELHNAKRDPEGMNGRRMIPRRLPSVPNLPSLRPLVPSPTSSSSSSTPSSISSLSPSSPGSSPPASSPGSASPGKSASQTSPRSRPLPQIPPSRHVSGLSQGQPKPGSGAHSVVCRNCLGCITTSECLLPSSAVPPGTRAFRGFSGKASLFTEVYNVSMSPPRMQLMTTGAHTMQETFCSRCSLCLGWKITKAHERSEKWKEGNWLLELENLWLMPHEGDLSPSSGKVVGWETEIKRGVGIGSRGQESYFGAGSKEYPKDPMRMVREKGLGLEFSGQRLGVQAYTQTTSRHQHSRSAPSFGGIGGYRGSASAAHLPMPCAG